MNKHKHDIERYLRGEMTAAEMHALEKEALHDPFLAEALEGIDHAGHDKFLFDLNELHKSVRQRTKARRGKVISITRWSYGIAAGLILLAASSVYIISLIQSNRSEKSSMQEMIAKKDSPAYADSIANSDTDTTNNGYLSYAEKDSKRESVLGPVEKPNVATEQAERQENDDALALTEVAEEQAERRELERIVTAELTEYPPVSDSVSTSEKIASGLATPSIQETLSGRAAGVTISNMVRGKVTSREDGLPLPGVNVVLKGTSTGTVTNAHGEYELTVNDPNQTLVFSFIGLRAFETKIADKKEVNVKMDMDQTQLSEVVVTGHGADNTTTTESNLLQFAEPDGGRQSFRRYLEERMIYPEEARKNKIEGRVTAQFSVDEQGNLSDFKIIRGIGHGCDEELIRLIQEGPRWSPSKRGDQPFKDRVRVRLRFSLSR